MRYKLIDILVCPECKGFPLALHSMRKINISDSNEFAKKRHNRDGFECSVFCGLKNKSIKRMESQRAGAEICENCLSINIVSGSLSCIKCNAKYKIERGIPRMIPKRFFKTHI
ncbi:MAG: hypothetical protein M1331_03770 [Candidatus Marsarchaeota archaeon]|nr:hypothetical protein [Candidatus Marsarchaeota archaeon]MCL5106485.1 hypothetical protein [Candidatus Marsarchaeota archaeon]